jgi:tetratricopeptide (TPR) repeat protein
MDQWTERLSEYLDEELPPDERAQVESHLAGCSACRTVLGELRAVTARAAALPPSAPATDLWPGISARLERHATVTPFRERAARRFSFSMAQLVAAAAALMLVSGGSVWLAQYGGRSTSLPPVGAADGTPKEERPAGIAPASFVDSRYDEAIKDLERTLDQGRSQLDPATVNILETNLAAIDRAIDQSRRALDADPANAYLHSHLAEARQQKLALLRRASALVGKS